MVSTIVPSASMTASSKNDFGCCRQTFSRVALKICCKRKMSAASKRRQKSPAVVGIGNAPGPQGVEVGFVAAQQFQVLQARSAGQQVVGDVEHVVAVVVGQMDFQQAEALVDGLIEPELPDQQVHGPDPAVGGGPGAIGDFVMDVGGGHDGPVTSAVVVFVQPPGDPPLALFDLFSYLGVHSKTSVRGVKGFGNIPLKRPRTPKVFEFFRQTTQANPSGFAWLRTSPFWVAGHPDVRRALVRSCWSRKSHVASGMSHLCRAPCFCYALCSSWCQRLVPNATRWGRSRDGNRRYGNSRKRNVMVVARHCRYK